MSLADIIIEYASLVTAVLALLGVFVSVYRTVEENKRQTQEIQNIQEELSVICSGLLACLQGLHEQGCDGPVEKAIADLNEHMNKSAHRGVIK